MRLSRLDAIAYAVAGVVTAALIAGTLVVTGGGTAAGPFGATGSAADVHGINSSGYAGDEAPPGVDVTDHVTEAELDARAAATAADASVAGYGPRTGVGCSGDGTTGNRVEILYVREAATASRYAAVLPALRAGASGVDSIFLASSLQTGGRTQVRWVHDASCVPRVTEVVVPNGSLATFSESRTALAALGYDDTDRHYLMMTDATVLCGIANYYVDNRPGQTNANNGGRVLYSRVDTGCWNLSGKTEAHEITHSLGAVLDFAPNKSAAGHCTDEEDVMCYVDGPGVVMTTPCPDTGTNILDCNHDDYFDTSPEPGSVLDANWNVARSSFLHDPAAVTATGGGTYVPGLASPVSVAPTVHSGQGWRVDWDASAVSPACTWAHGASLSGAVGATANTLSCPATATGEARATVTQQDGRSAAVTATANDAARTGTLTLGSSASVLAEGGTATLTATLKDTATGLAVVGAPVTVTGAGGAVAFTGTTNAAGVVAGSVTVNAATTYTARVDGGNAWAATSATTTISMRTPATLTLAPVNPTALPVAGTDVDVVATLTAGGTPVAGATVSFVRTAGSAGAATVTRTTNGSGVATAALLAGGGNTYVARFAGNATVGAGESAPWNSMLPVLTSGTAAVSTTSVQDGAPVTVTGTFESPAGTPLAGAAVRVLRQAGGPWTDVGGTVTDSAGHASFTAYPHADSAYRLRFLGDADHAATDTASTATVSVSYEPVVALTGVSPTATYGSAFTAVATVKSTAGTALAGRTVELRDARAAGTPLVASGVTAADGRATFAVVAQQSRDYVATVAAADDLSAGSSTVIRQTVRQRTKLTIAVRAPRITTGGYQVVTGALTTTAARTTPLVGRPAQLWALSGSTWTKVATVYSSATGAVSTTTRPRRHTAYQWRFAATADLLSSTSGRSVVSVRSKVSVSAPKKVRRATTFKVRGAVAPAGVYTVRIVVGSKVVKSVRTTKAGTYSAKVGLKGKRTRTLVVTSSRGTYAAGASSKKVRIKVR